MSELNAGERARMAGELLAALGIGSVGGAGYGVVTGAMSAPSLVAAGVNGIQGEPVAPQWMETIKQSLGYGATGALLGTAGGYGYGRMRKNARHGVQGHTDSIMQGDSRFFGMSPTLTGGLAGAGIASAIPSIGGLVNSFGQYQPVTASTPPG
jgi:hypothetical protein